MRPTLCLVASSLLASAAIAQAPQGILFTGRFPFVSSDAPNERPGGAITRLEEFDISWASPFPGFSIARPMLTTTAMQCYMGDADGDGVYTKFAGWKTYFQAIGIGGVFVKAQDRANVSWDKVYFSVRRNGTATGAASPGNLQVEVLTNGGTTPYTLVPGDWVRLMPNGDVDFFMTAAQLAVAVGPQNGAANIGAAALLQAANGDLYYSPVDGGHWVNGHSTGTYNAQDGAIVKIDAANITYDPLTGNVLAFAPNSARMLINEAAGGPGGTLTVRQMVLNSGAQDRTGAPIVVAGVYGKTGGLAFDPNGGTWTPNHPDAAGNYPPEPNLLFCSEAGSYGGTIFSTANNGITDGSVATINGVLCGSVSPGVPADGSWLGVQLDVPNFQPTLLGFTLFDLPPAPQPLIADMNGFGSLPVVGAQSTWDVDFFGTPFTPVFGLIGLGPAGAGLPVPSVPLSLLPPIFTPNSWPDVFLVSGQITLGVTVLDSFGYGTISVPNPNVGGYTGFTIMVQGLGLQPNGFELSSPVLVQLQ